MITARTLILPFFLIWASVCAQPGAAAALPPRIQQVLTAEGLPTSSVSILVRDAESGARLLEFNPATPRSPASTMKVLTTWAALDSLGPNHHWHTRLYADGPVVNGRLQGNLVIMGGGDPGLTTEHWWRLVRQLRGTGIHTITGDILIDRGLYKSQHEDPDEFDGHGYRTYNVLPDALLVNLQTAEFHANAENGDAKILLDPMPANLHIDNRVRAALQGCPNDHGLRFTSVDADPLHMAVDGSIGPACPVHGQRAIMTAPDFAFGTFVTLWRSLGGHFDGDLRLAPRPVGSTLIVDQESDSLAEVVRNTNKWSSNAMARMLLLTLAADRYGAPVGADDGERAVKAWLERAGLTMPELVVDNGSGLSRLARISAGSMTDVLLNAFHSRYFPEFIQSLPIGGQDGTLRRRFVDLAGDACIRMKTGHLAGVAAIAGYVTSRSGRTLTVVAIVNASGAEAGRGDAVIDTLVRWAHDRS
jgi:D-alanyl-D-alanine carboxypeptidase/D-alanyl-D-alanine-endopeptidase (penicillin-binding protein 4)